MKKNLTEIVFILDRSGSMSGLEADTIGGLVVQEFGHLPQRGEKITIGPLLFTVARADNRRLHTLMAIRAKEEEQ